MEPIFEKKIYTTHKISKISSQIQTAQKFVLQYKGIINNK